jgi:hypothetical protein
MGLLGCGTDRAIIRMAGPHAQTPNGLQSGIADGHRIGAQGERLGEVSRRAKTAGDH